MNWQRLAGRIGLVALSVAVGGWATEQVALSLAPTSDLWFSGTSTVRSWKCKAPVMTAAVDAASPEVAKAILAGEKAVRTVRLTIPSAKLDCDNGTMNGHMQKALNVDKQPSIIFALSTYELAGAAAARTGTLQGTLSINGMEQPITLQTTFADAGAGALRVKGTYVLQMTKFGVKPPTLMLGTMKVGDDVTVGFDLVVKP